MKSRTVSFKVLAAIAASSVVFSSGTTFARDYAISEVHPGGIDPNMYLTNVTVGSNILVSWRALQGPFQLEWSTNQTRWYPVLTATTNAYFTNGLSGTWVVPNQWSELVSFRMSGPAAEYRSAAPCSYCHQDVVNSWDMTPHRQALTHLGSMSNNAACLPCHTVGYGYSTGYSTNSSVPNLGGVQCENCHGPAGGHAGEQFTPAVTLSALMCGGCHQAVNPENNHSIFVDWEAASHAEVNEEFGATFLTNDLAASQGRMGSCGFCHSGAVRLSLVKNEGALPSGEEAFEIGQTCAVCHDPHDAHPENGGYHLRNPMSSTNYYNFATSQTGQPAYSTNGALNYSIISNNFWKQYNPNVQICAQCHNARGAVYTSSSRPPHHSPQYNLLLGNLGTTSVTPAPQSPHATNCVHQCVDCHMDLAALPGHTNVAEHTFEPSTNACAVCHTNIAPDVLIANTHAEFSNRIDGVVTTLRRWALTVASDKLSSSKSNAWEYSTPGTLSVTNGAPAPSSANQVWVPSDIQKARFNVYLVAYDGSLGVHNSNYERHLLDTASNLVEGLISSAGTVNAGLSEVTPSAASVQPYDNPGTNLTIRVQARDVNGKKMTSGGATVAITELNGVGSLGSTIDSSTGIYYAVWTGPSDTNGAKAVFRATLNSLPVGSVVGATQCVVTLVGPVDASHSTISPSIATNSVGTNRVITVQARDSRDNNRIIGGDTVVFSATLGTMNTTGYGGSGTYTNKWTAPAITNGSPAVITATLGGVSVGTAVGKSNCVITVTP